MELNEEFIERVLDSTEFPLISSYNEGYNNKPPPSTEVELNNLYIYICESYYRTYVSGYEESVKLKLFDKLDEFVKEKRTEPDLNVKDKLSKDNERRKQFLYGCGKDRKTFSFSERFGKTREEAFQEYKSYVLEKRKEKVKVEYNKTFFVSFHKWLKKEGRKKGRKKGKSYIKLSKWFDDFEYSYKSEEEEILDKFKYYVSMRNWDTEIHTLDKNNPNYKKNIEYLTKLLKEKLPNIPHKPKEEKKEESVSSPDECSDSDSSSDSD